MRDATVPWDSGRFVIQGLFGVGHLRRPGAEGGRAGGKSLKDQGEAKQKQGEVQVVAVAFFFVHGVVPLSDESPFRGIDTFLWQDPCQGEQTMYLFVVE